MLARRRNAADLSRVFDQISVGAWIALAIAAMGIGVSKSGLAGLGMIHILIFAEVFQARQSTGALLPLLIVGDICAVIAFGRHGRIKIAWRMLPTIVVGILVGWWSLNRMDDRLVARSIGAVILTLTLIQLGRMYRPASLNRVGESPLLASVMGGVTGFTTMIANAAGPVAALYLLAIRLPKMELVGTMAWMFLIVNLIKVPFSLQLGLIDTRSLAVDAVLAPLVAVGMVAGYAVVRRLPQKWFDTLLLLATGLAAIRLLTAV